MTIESLRTEIIESEKSRIDLLKWKFIAISALGSIALGVGLKESNPSRFLPEATLCLIPLVCVYVDLLCKHLNLRILVISEFIKISPHLKDETAVVFYENFCDQLRKKQTEKFLEQLGQFFTCTNGSTNGFTNKIFELEDFAQESSTRIIIFLLMAMGVILILLDNNLNLLSKDFWLCNIEPYLIIFGLIGLILARVISLNYQRNIRELRSDITIAIHATVSPFYKTIKEIEELLPDDQWSEFIRSIKAINSDDERDVLMRDIKNAINKDAINNAINRFVESRRESI